MNNTIKKTFITITLGKSKAYSLFKGTISDELRSYIKSEKYIGTKLMRSPDTGFPKLFTVIDISQNGDSRLEGFINACIDDGFSVMCRYGFGFDYEIYKANFVSI